MCEGCATKYCVLSGNFRCDVGLQYRSLASCSTDLQSASNFNAGTLLHAAESTSLCAVYRRHTSMAPARPLKRQKTNDGEQAREPPPAAEVPLPPDTPKTKNSDKPEITDARHEDDTQSVSATYQISIRD